MVANSNTRPVKRCNKWLKKLPTRFEDGCRDLILPWGGTLRAENGVVDFVVWISWSVRSGKGREAAGTAGESRGMSGAEATFCRRFRMRTARFAARVTANGLLGRDGSLRGGVRKEPVDLCHFAMA